ncbi:DUF1569 domain-containing protein [Spongiivirga citrea]|uniref:DUF1569 domain-containing protein n=1 Tax=Spongiivirga citrea TaxID=1481457 RepID=A0A6M0CNH7_9FLAO|nr:DUF1569 domain-containing protein [Spongiivirga citrea]NER17007.1 DUF1569 domain-containing protein [Spongiivirga citrea]
MIKRIIISITLVLVMLFVTAAIVNNKEQDPDFLNDEIITLEKYIQHRDVKNTNVSQVAVAWHLDHTLKTINRIAENLETSDPNLYESSFSVPRLMSNTFGFIPRGRAESPQNVRPPEIIKTEDIYNQIKEVKQNLEKIDSLDEKVFFEHPVFNNLNRDQTRRFLKVHTQHHLKIIRDILND